MVAEAGLPESSFAPGAGMVATNRPSAFSPAATGGAAGGFCAEARHNVSVPVATNMAGNTRPNMGLAIEPFIVIDTASGKERSYTPTGNGFGLDSSALAPLRQRSKRPWRRDISPVYQ